jgi:hypothetical protein
MSDQARFKVDAKGETTLFEAIRRNLQVKDLKWPKDDVKAFINVTNKQGNTALHECTNVFMFKWLLLAGANPLLGNTLCAVARRGDFAIMQAIADHLGTAFKPDVSVIEAVLLGLADIFDLPHWTDSPNLKLFHWIKHRVSDVTVLKRVNQRIYSTMRWDVNRFHVAISKTVPLKFTSRKNGSIPQRSLLETT